MARMNWDTFDFSMRDLVNALLNGNRGTEAPYLNESASVSGVAEAALVKGGPHIVSRAPAVSVVIHPVPQNADFTHVSSESRMLPAFSLESTSGGWVALSYAFDPPPEFPTIIIPQAQWNAFGGETEITGLTSTPYGPLGALSSFPGLPMPEFGYPGIIGSVDNVTATGTL
jgi:hypothetical protein